MWVTNLSIVEFTDKRAGYGLEVLEVYQPRPQESRDRAGLKPARSLIRQCSPLLKPLQLTWIPACAGMTTGRGSRLFPQNESVNIAALRLSSR
jgi:hypothetical protein